VSPQRHPLSARLGVFRARSRELGPRYALLAAAHGAARRAGVRLEDALLRIEGEAGVLGPAHRAYRAHSPAENRDRWTGWDWSAGGEEWTESPEWKASLVEHVLVPGIPAGGTVLEVGPGAGRWSEHLRERAERLVLVDVTERALDLCRERFGDDPRVSYALSSGSDLPGVDDASVDAVWSFDVFVHVAPLDVAGYLSEIARVLRPGGVAVIHHAGARGRVDAAGTRGWRAPMTARLFAVLARERGLEVERQVDSWDGGRHGIRVYGDVITSLRRPGRET
jgi:SAM-dependent methyltransferase